jgi:hypothetical protein
MYPAVEVDSRMVSQVQYDEVLHELHLTYKGRNTKYTYSEVPEDVYDILLAAPSKGEFIKTHIQGAYAYRRA